MTTKEIAEQLTNYCRAGEFTEAYSTLFADNAKSIESDGSITEGLTAILKKSEGFGEEVQFIKCEIGMPLVVGAFFTMEQTFYSLVRKTGKQKKMQELAVYKVVDGKIVEERFFY